MNSQENNTEKSKVKRFRSPPYPAFDLDKAVQLCILLQGEAHHHEVGIDVVAAAFKMESLGGKVWRQVAALIQYGLLTDSGSGKSRKFKLTDVAKRLVHDTDNSSEKRKKALEVAALNPMIHQELYSRYGAATGLSNSVMKAHLTIEREEAGEAPYSPSAAEDVISTYRSTLVYAGISDARALDDGNEDKGGDTGLDRAGEEVTGGQSTPKAKIGDYIQWTSGGADQFVSPKKVEWVSPNHDYVRVFGNPTGIEMSEVTVVELPVVSPQTPTEGSNAPPFTVYQVGNRLQITADVDAAGLKKLKKLLEKYEEILELLN